MKSSVETHVTLTLDVEDAEEIRDALDSIRDKPEILETLMEMLDLR